MSGSSAPLRISCPQPKRPGPELLKQKLAPASVTWLRVGFWASGFLLAAAQAWTFRYQVSADSISYLDMSDAVFPGSNWHRLINGVWSPLYPLLLGIFRRIFSISPANEIVVGHLLNLVFFLFAFACFEFFLQAAVRQVQARNEIAGKDDFAGRLPTWSYLSLGYSLFLWASIAYISVRNLRADMLMSGFVYLAIGILLRMKGRPAHRNLYVALGFVLGIGYLTKVPFFPISLVILVSTMFIVQNWRPAVEMTAISLAIFLVIASAYFVPLSVSRGYFTLGESSTFNYLIFIDNVRPKWYLQDPGSARGTFTHPPERIFNAPPAYAFSEAQRVTHPLRFDPSDWVAGVHPRFALRGQTLASIVAIRNISELLRQMALVVMAALALALFSWERGRLADLVSTWPIWLIGAVGCALYIPVHVEPRYVAEFLALFWFGIILAFRIPARLSPNLALACTIVIVGSLLLPTTIFATRRYFEYRLRSNADAQAAAQLVALGLRSGDRVARISHVVTDLGVERIARVEVIEEVDIRHATEFWSAPLGVQRQLLSLFVSHGARAVIATSPEPTPERNAEWRQLGPTQYWIWLPKSSH
jgi:hypothetical protein